jgi:hypothetical protein
MGWKLRNSEAQTSSITSPRVKDVIDEKMDCRVSQESVSRWILFHVNGLN